MGAEKRDDEALVANDEAETSPTSTGAESDKETATETVSESKESELGDQTLHKEEKQDTDELVEETTSQTLDNNDNGDENAAIKDTSDELVEEKTSETLDAVKNDDAKEPISKNAAEKISKEEKLSQQLKAKVIGAKANLAAFLLKIKKEEKNKEEKETDSASSKSQTHVANLAATTNAPSTTTKTA